VEEIALMSSIDDSQNTKNQQVNPSWNYHPELPIKTSAVFSWPPKPVKIIMWIAKSWLVPSERTLWLVLGFATWLWFMPPVEQMKNLTWNWVLFIYLRNLISAVVIATVIHLYFHTFKRQGLRLGYEKLDLTTHGKHRRFTFNNQLLDNMFWTLGSGVTIWTAYEVLYFWAFANGFMPTLEWSQNPVWFVALFVLIPLWSSVHFYWVHRMLHWPPLYHISHSVHHRNVITGPWSGLSMHPIEHLLYYSSILLHVVVATHPVHMLFHLYLLSLNPMAEHSGYEGLEVRGKNRFDLGNFFHQLHHRHFKCNYGSAEMPWDKWFDSFHDGTPEASRRIRKRRW